MTYYIQLFSRIFLTLKEIQSNREVGIVRDKSEI